MLVREFSAAIRNQSLPADAYAFYKVEGTALAADFGVVRSLFLKVLTSQHPELETDSMPGLIETVANASTRLAFGGTTSGSGWHVHGPALLGVAAGTKSWYVRDPARSLPTWLGDTLKATGQSTDGWLQLVNAARKRQASAGVSDRWQDALWHCDQTSNALMFIPAGLHHAVHNKGEVFALSVQVDMHVGGTLLHATAFHGHEEGTRLLLKAGANVGALARSGGTPLHFAAMFGHLGVVQLLLAAGAKTYLKDSRGHTPLQISRDFGEARSAITSVLSTAAKNERLKRKRNMRHTTKTKHTTKPKQTTGNRKQKFVSKDEF
jgi:hypothetical protein